MGKAHAGVKTALSVRPAWWADASTRHWVAHVPLPCDGDGDGDDDAAATTDCQRHRHHYQPRGGWSAVRWRGLVARVRSSLCAATVVGEPPVVRLAYRHHRGGGPHCWEARLFAPHFQVILTPLGGGSGGGDVRVELRVLTQAPRGRHDAERAFQALVDAVRSPFDVTPSHMLNA